MSRSLASRTWYEFVKTVLRLTALGAFRIRCQGAEFLPRSGGGIVLSNHQSNLDPILVGICSPRRMNFVARQTLFGFAPFGWLINSLDAIPIDRDGSGLGGLKETLKRLKRGELVLIFPEGTRTADGKVNPIKPGFAAIAKRAAVPVIPVALDGAFQSWPRDRTVPRPTIVHVRFGPPILPDEVARLTDAELLAEVDQRIRHCHEQARQSRLAALGAGC